MKLYKYLIAGILFIFSGASQAVVINGLEWRQPTDTFNFSYNDVSTVCSVVTGSCSGNLGTVSFTGWTWASNSELSSLFNFYNPAFVGPIQVSTEASSSWGPIFFDDFNSTFVTDSLIEGRTREKDAFDRAGYGVVNDQSGSRLDFMEISFSGSADRASNRIGHWLYRDIDTVDVPEPSTYLLMGLGLLGLTYARRESSISKVLE